MLLSPDYVTSKVLISQKKAFCIITTKLSYFKLIQLTQNYASFLYCEFRLVFFYLKYIVHLSAIAILWKTDIKLKLEKGYKSF